MNLRSKITSKTTKLLEENRDINLCDLGLGNDFLDMTSNSRNKRKKTNERNSSKNLKCVLQRTPSKN